jgi:CHASE2 domain-containing sensor protein/tRNA A-37 threonylcarbamoyl transferase component Bud32
VARSLRPVLTAGVIALTIAGLATVFYETDVLKSLELDTVDARFSLRGSQTPPKDVVLVALDDRTLGELGLRPPLPRRLHARVIDYLRRAGARVIAYDFQFTTPTDRRDDLALFDAAGRAHNVVFGTSYTDAHGHTNVLGGDANLREIGAIAANGTLVPDRDGVVRRFRYSLDRLRGFAVAVATRAGRPADRPDFRGQGAWIDFRGPPGTVRSVPLSRLLSGSADRRLFQNRVVVVGATAPVLQDLHATSAPGGELMSGAEIEANAIDTAMRGEPLRGAGAPIDIVLILLLASIAPFTAVFARQRWALALGVAALALLFVAAQLAFDAGRLIAVTYSAAAGVVALGGSVGIAYLAEHRERDRLRQLFADFQPDVVEAVLEADGDHSGAVLGREEVIAGYRVDRLVGRGGMGVVYEAVQLALDRRVALKLIRPAYVQDPVIRERFKRESRLAAAVEHPHIIPVYEAGEDGDILFIAMRLIPGVDLASLIARESPLDPHRTVRIISQVASALDAAHARGLVHRDVKPSNVLVAGEGSSDHVYLTDFGLTKEVGSRDALTRPGRFVGTLDYMSPEQLRGRELGPATDIYALGCVLYESLAGHVPFAEQADADVIVAHLESDPPRLADKALAAFDPVIARALAKRPADRFRSAGEFAAAACEVAERLRPGRRPGRRRAEPDRTPRSLRYPESRMTSTPTEPGGDGAE